MFRTLRAVFLAASLAFVSVAPSHAADIQIAEAVPFVRYTASASQTAFAYPWPILSSSHLLVYRNDSLRTLAVHYTVSGVGSQTGGTVTFIAPSAASDEVVIFRNDKLERTSLYGQGRLFTPSLLNDDLNRIWLAIQSLRARTMMAPSRSVDDWPGVQMSLPTGDADLCLGWNADGDAAQLVNRACTGVGGGGDCICEAEIPQGRRTVATLQNYLEHNAVFAVEDYGAVCDGVTDDAAAFALAGLDCEDAGGGTIAVPASAVGCVVASPFVLADKCALEGEAGAKIIAGTVNQASVVTMASGREQRRISDVFIDGKDKALIGLYLPPVVVQAEIENVWVEGAKRHGIYFSGTQNVTLVNVHAEHNGSATGQLCAAYDETTFECGAGVVFDNGAANIRWFGPEISNNTPHSILFWDDEDVSPAGVSADGPRNINFYGGVIERPAWSCSGAVSTECTTNADCSGVGTCSLPGATLVYRRAGIHIAFHGTNFSTHTAGGSPAMTGIIGVRLTAEEKTKGCTTCLAGHSMFDGGFYSVGGTSPVGFQFEDTYLDIINMPMTLDAGATALKPDDASTVEVGPRMILSGLGTECTPLDVPGLTCAEIVRSGEQRYPERSLSSKKFIHGPGNDVIIESFSTATCAGGTTPGIICAANADCTGDTCATNADCHGHGSLVCGAVTALRCGGVCGGHQPRIRIFASGAIETGAGRNTCLGGTTPGRGCGLDADCAGAGATCQALGGSLANNIMPSGTPAFRTSIPLMIQGVGPGDYAGTGSPESVIVAKKGSVYRRVDGDACTVAYLKASGDNTNTGWLDICSIDGSGSSFGVGGICLAAFTGHIFHDTDCDGAKGAGEAYIDAPDITQRDLNPSLFDGVSQDYEGLIPTPPDITDDDIFITINTAPWYQVACAEIDDIDDWGKFCVYGDTLQDVHFGAIIPANAAGKVSYRKTYE